MGKKCCINCFYEPEIKSFISEYREKSACDYCGSKKTYCAYVEDVGNFIREGIERAYEAVYEGSGAMYDHEEKCFTNEGEPIDEILKWQLDIISYRLVDEEIDELCGDLIQESGPSIRDIQHGAVDWIANENLVVRDSLYGQENTSEYQCWEAFKNTCKYNNRFFDLAGRKSSRAKILSNLNDIFSSMKINLPKGSILYRARIYSLPGGSELKDIDLLKEISPAPPEKAKNNRMSPAGISYTYLAQDLETCLHEIRSQSGDTVMVGEFKTKRILKLLDLSCNPGLNNLSCFSPEYDHAKNWLGDFLDDFRDEISAPIDDDDKDLEYVATQMLAEYIRKLGFHGIKFRSSLNPKGMNIVLFCSINPYITHVNYVTLITPFTNWLNLIEVQYNVCDLGCNVREKLQHNDKDADYHKTERRRNEYNHKINNIISEFIEF